MPFTNMEQLKIHLNLQNIYLLLAISALLVALFFIFGRVIKSSRMSNDQKRRMIGNARFFFIFVFIISIFTIFATELYSAVLSFAAIGAALAIATKELLLCFSGTFYRTFAKPYSVGDRIEVAGIRGDVIDVGMMGTQLLEVGPGNTTHQYTGRTVSIPNSQLLTQRVINETATAHSDRDYGLHTFSVPVKNDEKWKDHRTHLLKASEKACQQYFDDATRYFKKITEKQSVDMPGITPRINVKFVGPSELNMIVRITVPVKLKGRIEQKIIANYLNQVHTNITPTE